jgi:dolichol-phosphate mannosyltransferase
VTKELIFTATYNERTNIGWWIEEVAKARPGSDILIVDDNSPDGTGELIKQVAETFPQITLHSRVGGTSSWYLTFSWSKFCKGF